MFQTTNQISDLRFEMFHDFQLFNATLHSAPNFSPMVRRVGVQNRCPAGALLNDLNVRMNLNN
jgi:hypothetical protein